jgi:FtsP/CotA-like multicopper oxidase with cupredoxin domain
MKKNRIINLLVLLTLILSLFISSNDQVLAQNPNPPGQENKPEKKEKITQADREAAAQRAADAGFTLEAMAMALPAAPGEAPRYFSHPNYANSPLPVVTTDPVTGDVLTIDGGIRKFVDTLPQLDTANNLGQFIPVAVPDTTTYPGSDYYEIAVVQYREQMHSDLPPTLLRGYVQISTGAVPGAEVPLSNALLDGTSTPIAGFTGVTDPHYMGPAIVAQKDRPVRIKFYNLLPTGVDGNLFLPVDTTVMGSGMGPLADMMTENPNPQIPICDGVTDPLDACYTENRAIVHLHGGISPWISDGTPHQWITPAGEDTPYPEGVSVVPVPDMEDTGDPNDGVMTFYYTNQQSARLMFYHDHAWGITRLNVYAGEAAPYIITDATEQMLLDNGLIPPAADTIPLVIQDKTFVPSPEQLAVSDETWDSARWGGEGNLWLPHVYSPAQNPGDVSGVNQFGRWAYGPWFWPPTINIENGPIANPYYDDTCNPDLGWCEPPLMPGVPFNSMGMEAFMDTPVVNGTAYPTLTVDPKSYRFRILNAANDRFFNLSLYQAIDANGVVCDATNLTPAPESTGVACTEVALADVAAAIADPTVFPTPVSGTEGPDWIQIGTEGGFLPAPSVFPAHPTTWVNDPTVFNAGNVDLHSLLIAPAERADVIVDFSAFAGQTLILYNDAPAAFPARDPRYDYYTGDGDYRDTGGAPSTLPGYGPNTRTVMKIVVAASAADPAFDLLALDTAFQAEGLGGLGVFENGQHPIIVGQGAYNSAYGTSFQNDGPRAGIAQIFDTSLTFNTLSGNTLTMPFQPKMIQDEMGEAFEHEYGRMSGNLGVESPNPQAGQQNMILYGFTSPPTEIINGVELPPGVDLEPISTDDDGTQIWKFTHNGVDTHPVHFHLYDVQLLNRVGWDGIVRKPDANELGWKDTVRISPLEDTIVALRPLIPNLPEGWDLPNSIRLLDPSMPDGAVIASSTQAEAAGLVPMAFDPTGEPIDIFNHYVNFGWEYVMHCHILSHEEMDMMRPVAVGVEPNAPSDLTAVLTGNGKNQAVVLTWMDNSMNDTSFTVERSLTADGPWEAIAFLQSPFAPSKGTTVSYTDPIGNTKDVYFYRVFASNTIGDTWDYSDPNLNEGASFPTLNLDSIPTDVATFGSTAPTPPAAPTNLSALLQAGPQALLTWTDNSKDETGFVIERSLDGVVFSVLAQVGSGVVSYTDSTISTGSTFTYRVAALNSAGSSVYSNTASISLAAPAAPSNLTAGAVRRGNNARVTLTWVDNSVNENGFTIQWASDAGFTNILMTTIASVNATTFTTSNLNRNTDYFFRIQTFNASGVSAWVNASPFPIRTP